MDYVSVISVRMTAWSLCKCIWETDVWVDKEEDDVVCDGVLCRWRSPGYSPGARSLFHAAQTQPALHRGKHQSVLSRAQSEGFPSPITTMILTHTHTHRQGHARKLHICSKAYKRMLPHTHTHASTHRVGLFLLHTLTCPQCPPSVYSWRPRCWYHLILSQLHQPTPYTPQQELFFFFPYTCTCVLSVFFVSFNQYLGLYHSRYPNKYKINIHMNTIWLPPMSRGFWQ